MEFTNTYITHEGQRYSVYWTSEYAQHVLENFADPGHGVDHTTISRILQRARYIIPKVGRGRRRPYLHTCLTVYQGVVYESYVYLVPELAPWPARCVVLTCYKSRNPDYLSLFIPQPRA